MFIWIERIKIKLSYPKIVERGHFLSIGNYRIIKYNAKRYQVHQFNKKSKTWQLLQFYHSGIFYKNFTSYEKAKRAILKFDGLDEVN